MRTDLELFVLAMAQRGLATPYDLKMRAGLSLGSTVPVLKRLEDDGLLKGSEEGARRSRKFSITMKGAKTLKTEWAEHLASRQTDVDSIARIASLAWLNGAQEDGAKFLDRSAAGMRGWAGTLRAEAERFAATTDDTPDADVYRWLRTYCEAARVDATAAALVELSGQLNKTRRSKPAKKVKRP